MIRTLDIALLVVMVGMALATVMAARLLRAAIALAITSVVLAVLMYRLTAQIAVQILTGARAQALRSHNFFRIDAENYVLEKFAVRRLKDCEVCGVRN